MVDRSLDSDITAPLLIEKLRERYKIPEGWSDEDARAVIGMRYEFDLRGISKLPTYTFIQDISDENLSAILELNTPGLMVESSTVREYHTKYAAHILGYMGGMDAADWEKYEKEGYSMDAYIGQSGFEEAFEDYLHGIDGQRVDVVSKDGTIVEQFWRVNQKTGEVYTPIAGNNVETTIDLELQGIAEDSLANIMKERGGRGGHRHEGQDRRDSGLCQLSHLQPRHHEPGLGRDRGRPLEAFLQPRLRRQLCPRLHLQDVYPGCRHGASQYEPEK